MSSKTRLSVAESSAFGLSFGFACGMCELKNPPFISLSFRCCSHSGMSLVSSNRRRKVPYMSSSQHLPHFTLEPSILRVSMR